jgi:hypothetical protein
MIPLRQGISLQQTKKTLGIHFDLLLVQQVIIFSETRVGLYSAHTARSKSPFRFGDIKCDKMCHLFLIRIEPVDLQGAAKFA